MNKIIVLIFLTSRFIKNFFCGLTTRVIRTDYLFGATHFIHGEVGNLINGLDHECIEYGILPNRPP